SINKIRNARGTKIWQDGFRDDALRMPDAIQKAIRYVIFNPVKAGLVQKPEDYPFVAWDFET
ncbi:MAG: IS200/IS605 family transposase, partial [Chloroflexi bacterium]